MFGDEVICYMPRSRPSPGTQPTIGHVVLEMRFPLYVKRSLLSKPNTHCHSKIKMTVKLKWIAVLTLTSIVCISRMFWKGKSLLPAWSFLSMSDRDCSN